MSIYTKEKQFELIRENPFNLEKIDNQYEDVCLEAVRKKGLALKYVKNQTENICLEAIKQNEFAFEYVYNLTHDICLYVVKRSGFNIKSITNQTYDICLEAVKENGLALEYIKEQTEEICLEAVKTIGLAIQHVKDKTPQICFYAFLNNYNLLEFEEIKNGVEEYIKSNEKIKDTMFILIDKNLDDLIDENSYDEYYLSDNIWGTKKYEKIEEIFKSKNKYDCLYTNIKSLNYSKNFLLKENSNNHFIFYDNTNYIDNNLLKDIALSNNELIVVDTGNIKDNHKLFSNKIVKFN